MPKNIDIRNKKASFDYFFIEDYVAGIQLFGHEVKAIKEGKITLIDSFCYFENGEIFAKGLTINSTHDFSTDSSRKKKLLLKKKEILKLEKNLVRGTSIVIKRIFSNQSGRIKVEISLSKGKRDYDKRNTIKERETKREIRTFI